MEQSTHEASQKSNQTTCADTPNAISLQELGGGQEPCSLLDGQQIDLFGQALVPANRSAARGSKKVKKTPGICGLSGSTSSASAALQQSLENRLQARLPTGGLTTFIKTWNAKATPAGRRYCQLAVSARPINATDCGLWPTPKARDHRREGKGKFSPSLPAQLERLARWPTPTVRDHKDTGALSGSMTRADGKSRMDCLPRVAFGTAESGSTAQTEKRGSLNPQFPCWLMGYPKEWDDCGIKAPRAFRVSKLKNSTSTQSVQTVLDDCAATATLSFPK